MIFFVDESVDFALVKELRKKHQVIYAAEIYVSLDDEFILLKAVEANAVVITKDKDFGEMIVRHQKLAAGLVLIRVNNLNEVALLKHVLDTIHFYESELSNSFLIIQEDKIRLRKL